MLAQKQLFAHSIFGDLTPLLSHYFDTRVGAKGEASSYERIAQEVGVPPSAILFLSDVGTELTAARASGFQTIQILREGTLPAAGFAHQVDFSLIK